MKIAAKRTAGVLSGSAEDNNEAKVAPRAVPSSRLIDLASVTPPEVSTRSKVAIGVQTAN